MEECYEDQIKHVHAVETRLSSDPPMNWSVSQLNRYTILSFSDSHSPYPYRLRRRWLYSIWNHLTMKASAMP